MRLRGLAVAFIACMLGICPAGGQTADRQCALAIEDYFASYQSQTTRLRSCRLDRKKNNIHINVKAKKITIMASVNFGYQIFTPELVELIYENLKSSLPHEYKNYRIEVVVGTRPIESLIPNAYRKKGIDNTTLWRNANHSGNQWVTNISCPYNINKGLAGRHLAIWQSHGRFYKNEKRRWEWQRPSLYSTAEDIFTQSIVVPFLMPMLENAGAIVYSPRERDWQRNSVIVDNDNSQANSQYMDGSDGNFTWEVASSPGYAPGMGIYVDGDNPFLNGTAKFVKTNHKSDESTAVAKWIPDIPSDGRYAVYVSYQSLPNSVADASYSIIHSGGITQFKVNQKIGNGTWVYLGTFFFNKGISDNQMVILTNKSSKEGVVSADAVRFGGGMGQVARGDSLKTSGLPAYLEGARYSLQMAGFPYNIYSPGKGEKDYNDDINGRSHALNYLTGGSVYAPDSMGLGVPFELAFGLHSDAGVSEEDEVVGTIGIVTTDYNKGVLASGISRFSSRDFASIVLKTVKDDIDRRYGINWTCRGILDRNYSESRIPVIPSMIFESLSHQNFSDMRWGHDPDFKFTMARAIYKALLRQISFMHNENFVVQPLPVKDFAINFADQPNVVNLGWQSVVDDTEPTAHAKNFVLYTRINNNEFDNGRLVDGNNISIKIVPGVQYSFKVSAVNDGGESFCSEILSTYIAEQEAGRMLIVNGFHRLSGPETVSSETQAGFLLDSDIGLPYIKTPEYCGRQLNFERTDIGLEDGMGYSGSELEGMLIAGNSFDYPYIHGKAAAANNFSFVSCSSEAILNNKINLKNYRLVDFILGAEKQGGRGSFLHYNHPYKTFPKRLQEKIKEYCDGGGSLFISGANVACDMIHTAEDRDFIRNVLKYDYGGYVADTCETTIFGSNLTMSTYRGINEHQYALPRTDILIPLQPAFTSFVYENCKESAGVAYMGEYRVLSTSFPFENIRSEELRGQLMGAIIRFLYRNK